MNCPTHTQWCAKEGGKSRKQSEGKFEKDLEIKLLNVVMYFLMKNAWIYSKITSYVVEFYFFPQVPYWMKGIFMTYCNINYL